MEYNELVKTNKRVKKKADPSTVSRGVQDGWHKVDHGKCWVYTVGNVVKMVTIPTPDGVRTAQTFKRIEDYKTGAYSYEPVENVPYVALAYGGLSRHYYEVY